MKLLSLPSKQKFGAFVMFASLSSLTGCANWAISSDDMRNHRVNCDLKDQELRFLERTTYNKDDQLIAAIQVLLLGPLTPDYEKKKQIATGSAAFMVQDVKEEYRRCKS